MATGRTRSNNARATGRPCDDRTRCRSLAERYRPSNDHSCGFSFRSAALANACFASWPSRARRFLRAGSISLAGRVGARNKTRQTLWTSVLATRLGSFSNRITPGGRACRFGESNVASGGRGRRTFVLCATEPSVKSLLVSSAVAGKCTTCKKDHSRFSPKRDARFSRNGSRPDRDVFDLPALRNPSYPQSIDHYYQRRFLEYNNSVGDRSTRLGPWARCACRCSRRLGWQTGARQSRDQQTGQIGALVRRNFRGLMVDSNCLLFSTVRPVTRRIPLSRLAAYCPRDRWNDKIRDSLRVWAI